MEFFDQILPSLKNMGVWGYWLILAVTFGESFVLTGMFVPGTVIMVIMGSLAPYGYYDWGDLAFFGIVGAIAGQAASYELGRKGRVHVERWKFLTWYMARGKDFFDKHQKKSVFLGRFVGPIRPVIPFLAGVLDMPRVSFYVSNVLSAFLWLVCYLTIGYVAGIAWKRALLYSSAAISIGVGILVVAVLGTWFWRWYRHKKIIPGKAIGNL